MYSPIHNTFGPMVTKSQLYTAWQLQWQPWRWQHGSSITKLHAVLRGKFNRECYTFSSGRQALLAGFRSMQLTVGDEVIVPAYTCAAVINPIIACGATPIYCDCTRTTLCSTAEQIEQKITPQTKAVLVQHTVGIATPIQKVTQVCTKHNLILIEDLAHTIPTDEAAGIGMYGDFILLSFGRDKAISGITGGAILTNVQAYTDALDVLQKQATPVSKRCISQLLGYPIRYSIAKKFWLFGCGKLYLKLLAIFKLLPPIFVAAEREGKMNTHLQALPNACAVLALRQWKKLRVLNAHRTKISLVYQQELATHAVEHIPGAQTSCALQKYPILVHNRNQVLQRLLSYNIHLQDGWQGAVINPPSIQQNVFQYTTNTCPVAEEVASKILLLPVHPTTTRKQALYLVKKLKNVLANQTYNDGKNNDTKY